MKKISNVNLGGRVISIQDNAWQMHLAYIETLHCYFAREKGRFEIINDIENRIAELMQGLINKNNAGINKTDVKDIIRVIGTTDEFKELDTDDWDMAIDSPVHCQTGISTTRSFCDQTENAFVQPGEFKLCAN